MAFGSLLTAAPHFLINIPIDKKINHIKSVSINNSSMSSMSNSSQLYSSLSSSSMETLTCQLSNNCSSGNSSIDDVDGLASDGSDSKAIIALVLLVTAYVLFAIASSTYHVISIVYIDNNVPKSQSAVLIGFVYAFSTLGPAAAFFFSSFVSSNIYVHPQYDVDPLSPHFVGAWWIGFLLCAGMFLVFAPLLLLFPKTMMPETKNRAGSVAKKYDAAGTSLIPVSEQNLTKSEAEFSIAAIPRNALVLFRNKLYLALVVTGCAETYFVAGYFTFYQKYLESKFLQPTRVANFLTALANPIPCAIGTFLGGWMMSKLKWSHSHALLHCLVYTAIAVLGIGFLFLVECDSNELLGIDQNDASSLCGCDQCPKVFEPVCLADGRAFVSPCHAGCSLGNVSVPIDF